MSRVGRLESSHVTVAVTRARPFAAWARMFSILMGWRRSEVERHRGDDPYASGGPLPTCPRTGARNCRAPSSTIVHVHHSDGRPRRPATLTDPDKAGCTASPTLQPMKRAAQ